jgi:hypothetical protein
MTTPLVAEPAVVAPRRRGFGTTSLILGILLVIGVALWLLIGGIFFAALVWVFPIIVVAAFVIGAIHFVVGTTALVFGILALVKNRGRVAGAIGLLLTVIATVVTVFVAVFFVEVASALYGAGTVA